MRKEVVIAIILGIIIGLATAFGIWRMNSVVTTKPDFLVTESKDDPADPNPEQTNSTLTLATPNELDVIIKSPTDFSGITRSQSIVIISGEGEDYVIPTDNSGSFHQEVELAAGINQINLVSISSEGERNESTLTVIYSKEFENELEEEGEDESATDSASTIDEKVQDRINMQKLNPKAYIGAVTDKTEDSLQIRNIKGEIQLVSVVPDDVSFVKLNDTSAAIKYVDVGIGDFVAALGFQNGNSVLRSVRIIVTEPPQESSRKIIYANITSINQGEVTLNETSGSTWSLDFPRRWKGPEKNELEEGQRIIAVGDTNGNELTIRTIYIIE
jgi:hypothetical protein